MFFSVFNNGDEIFLTGGEYQGNDNDCVDEENKINNIIG